MMVEFYRTGEGDGLPVATAAWDGKTVTITAEDDGVRAALAHAFRRTPVVVDDSSRRGPGTKGEVVIVPGDLEWFRASAQVRAHDEVGLTSRFVPVVDQNGFDPAANYRDFDEQIERLDSQARN